MTAASQSNGSSTKMPTSEGIYRVDAPSPSINTPAIDSSSSSIALMEAVQPQPQPQHPFYTLPSELILDIVDYLPADAFINLAFANYPLLNSYGLAPALSRPRIMYITTQTHLPALFPLLRMPPEIT